MFPLGGFDFITIYPLAMIAVIIEPFLAIGLGVYSGLNIKKRWFFPIIECIVFFILFEVAERIAVYVLIKVAEWDLYVPEFEVIVLCIWLTLSLLAMFVTVIMRRKESRWIRVLVSFLSIIVASLSWGIGLNRKYCPTYYKYPDYIIKEVLIHGDDIEYVFGEFDINDGLRYGYGAYYAYTDEQGNSWYYTIYFAEGEAADIRMEIH
ncbi:MAG: hypothetical protein K2K17_12965 [Lachnospiraceae bacterium]|nr:hypothetical protein [Lachnospiraceae bacterium]